ncbi:MAG: DUF72 domain-containing protein [Candidatus Methylomirabilales bacterium]
MAQLFAGTSGFAYPSWKPRFYPAKLPQAKFLQHYATRLNCVEINYTFRRMPAATTLANWIAATPPGFRFALKAHERITHLRRLQNAAEPTEAFLNSIRPLGDAGRLGPVLFQLPPQCRGDVALLRDYLALLPPEPRCAFEFRHESWLTEPVYALLAERNVALCVAESETLEVPEVVTADFVYFRLRKPEYTAEEVAAARARADALLAAGKDVFVFFKHEETPEGALYAEQVLSRPVAAPSG